MYTYITYLGLHFLTVKTMTLLVTIQYFVNGLN